MATKKTWFEKWHELERWIKQDREWWKEKAENAEKENADINYQAMIATVIARDMEILKQMDRIDKQKLPWEE